MSEGAVHLVHNNFSAGELSPLLSARADFEKYNAGAETMENWFVLPHGGARTRWGTTFVAEVKDSAERVRLIPFEFSTDQAYILEFGGGYIRVYRNNGQIGGVITNAANSGTGLIRITSAGHTLATGDTIFINGVLGTAEANGFWVVTVIDVNTFDLQGSTYTNTYTGGGLWRVEIQSPYLSTDLAELQYAQSADVLYLVHRDYRPRKLERRSHTTWTLVSIDFIGGPFRAQDVGEMRTITPSGTTGAITLTASAALFTADHVGALWELTHGATTGYVKITGFTSATQVSADVKKALGGTTATSIWREGLWSGERGYPAAVVIHEDRLILGGSAEDPATLAGSVSGRYEDFTEGTKDDDSFVFQLGGSRVPAIVWMVSAQDLLIGTAGGEFRMTGGSNSGITPTNVFARMQTTHGSVRASPIVVGHTALFIERSRRKLRGMGFSLEADQFVAEDLTLLSEHITEGGLMEIAYQANPYGIVWSIRGDGRVLSLTTLESQSIRAWARHVSPAYIASLVDAFESVAVIAHPDGDRDQVWVVVRRKLPNGRKRYVERINDNVSLDSSLHYSGSPTTAVAGLGHLEGRTVGIVGDGAVYPPAVVSGGQVTLSGLAASEIDVGIVYPCTLVTNKPEANLGDGTTQGRPRKWMNVRLSFYRSLGVTFRTLEQSAGDTLEFRRASDPMDEPPPVFTGYKQIRALGWTTDGRVAVEQQEPLPATVLGIMGKIQFGDV